jgi:hypothetical protein
MLNKLLKKGFRLRQNLKVPFITEVEKGEYKKLYNESRRRNSDLFWHIQGIAENEYIGEFRRKLQ